MVLSKVKQKEIDARVFMVFIFFLFFRSFQFMVFYIVKLLKRYQTIFQKYWNHHYKRPISPMPTCKLKIV